MANVAPSISPEQLLEQVCRLSRRLSAHLDRVDSGELDFMDDVANITRTLLARGTGDDAIRRLCRQHHLDAPMVTVGAGTRDEPSTIISVGSVPVDPGSSDASKPEDVDLFSWLESTAVVADSTRSRRTSWHRLIAEFGNTFGAHLSQTVPDVLNASELYVVPGGSLGTYVLRSAAVVAENALRDLLPGLGVEESTRDVQRSMSMDEAHFGGLTLVREPDGVHLTFFFQAKSNGRHKLLTLPIGKRRQTIWANVGPGVAPFEFVEEPNS